MLIADILINVFTMESALLRSEKLQARRGDDFTLADKMCAVLLHDAMGCIEIAGRNVIGACVQGEALAANLSFLRRLTACDPLNSIELRRAISSRLLARERYVV